MDAKRGAFLGAAVLALLTLAYLRLGTGRSMRPERVAPEVAIPETNAPTRHVDPPGAREPSESTDAASEAEPQILEAPRAAPPADGRTRPETDRTTAAAKEALRMLEDEHFLAACVDLADIATPVLADLVEDTERAVLEWRGELSIQRWEAGLYEPIPGYEAGKPFKLRLDEGELLQSFFSSGMGDGNLVELPREEHPELYTLWDASKRFRAELRKRKSEEARGQGD